MWVCDVSFSTVNFMKSKYSQVFLIKKISNQIEISTPHSVESLLEILSLPLPLPLPLSFKLINL